MSLPICCGVAALFLGALGLTGCGPAGPERFEVNGSVTYQGAPVPAGSVVFEPDPKHGNQGPAGQALIREGQYRTLPDKGTIGGSQVVKIYAFDGKANLDQGSRHGRLLRSVYQIPLELPRANTTLDFAIPQEAKP